MGKWFFTAMLLSLATSASADWRYDSNVDQMTDKKVLWATLESNNSLKLKFPYAGRNYGTIYIRQHPKSGLNVMVSVEQGQILCSTFDECSVTVRFDDGRPITFSAVGPSDHSSNKLFLHGEAKFVAEAKKAKRILVALTMYQAGQQVPDFHSSAPLDWGSKPSAKPAPKL